MAAINLIKSCPLFFELMDDEIDAVLQSCVVQNFHKNELIIKENDLGRDFYVILSGSVRITKQVGNREVEITIMKKGGILGETVLISEGKRTANAIASSKVDVLLIDQDTIFSLFQKRPKIFAILMLNLSRMLSEKLHKSNRTIARMHERVRVAM